jgi:hypothetical protein
MSDEQLCDVSLDWTNRVMRAVRWAEQWYGQGTPPSGSPQILPAPPCSPFTPSGVTIPAYGVCVSSSSTAANGGHVHSVGQASVHGGGSLLLVNEGSDVSSSSQGIGWWAPAWWPQWALYDTADGSPAAGDSWGVKGGSFKLGPGLPGFRVLEVDATNGRVLVVRTEGDNTRTAATSSTIGTGGGNATLWYGGAPGSLAVSVSDDMLGAGDTIPANTMLTVQFWPHAQAWKVLNAACPAGS